MNTIYLVKRFFLTALFIFSSAYSKPKEPDEDNGHRVARKLFAQLIDVQFMLVFILWMASIIL